MEDKSIIKEKLQLELSLLEKDMENYYHNLLRKNKLANSKADPMLMAIKNVIPLNEEILKDRLGKTLYLSSLFLAIKLKEERTDYEERLDVEALWKILEHPLLEEPFIQEKIFELKLLKDRIFLLREPA